MMMRGNKAPSEVRDIETFTNATLVCYESSAHFNRFKGQKMWVLLGTSSPKLTNMSIFYSLVSKNGGLQHT